MKTFAYLLLTILCWSPSSSATRQMPPTLEDVVTGSELVSIARISSARDYSVNVDNQVVWCGVIYEAEVLASIKGDRQQVKFYSKQLLTPRATYLLYLSSDNLPRKLMSTNSLSESLRAKRLNREENCYERKLLPTTIFKVSKFQDRTHMAEIHKGQRWIESPPFLGRPLEAHVIIPTEIAINGEVTPRNQFIDEYLDGKHPRYQPIGFDALIFRAVNWNDYCNAISRRVLDEGGKVSPEQTDIFCNSPDIETVHTLGY